MDGMIPRPPEPGRAPGPHHHRDLVDSLVVGRIVESPDIRPVRGPGGTALFFKTRPGAVARPAGQRFPFRIIDASNPTDGWRVVIEPGIVALESGTRSPLLPDGGDMTDRTPQEVAGGVQRLWLHLEWDEDEVLLEPGGCALGWDTDAEKDNDFKNAWLLIGTVQRVGTEETPAVEVMMQAVTASVAHAKCNIYHRWASLGANLT